MFRHIVVVNGSYLSVVDGSIMTLRRMTAYLTTKFSRVTVLCAPSRYHRSSEEEAAIEVVPAISMPFQPEYRLPLRLTRRARDLLTAKDTLVHLGAPDTLAIAALKAARRAGTPVVSSFHSNIVSYFRYLGVPRLLEPLGWRYFRWFYGKCEQVYVPTPSIQRVLEDHGVEGDYRPWPRGVDGQHFNPAMRSLTWRRARGVEDTQPLVVFAARLKWEKGLSQLATIIEMLNERRPNVRTMIVGDGVAYKHLSERLSNTIFTGFLESTELATAYASADIFLYPSQTDTFGNVTLEAMASGLPVMCARAPGSESLVIDKRNGFLMEPEDASGYVEAILSLCDDTALRREMSLASLEISGNYTWERAFELLESYYAEVYRNQRRCRPDSARADSSAA